MKERKKRNTKFDLFMKIIEEKKNNNNISMITIVRR
jgi:hypothetical protein